jgi:hypothetical protein
MNKLDKSAFMTPAARAAQNGVGTNRTMMMVGKINEIIEALGTVATAATVAAISTQMSAVLEAQNAFVTQLDALAGRVKALEIGPAEAIANVNEGAVTITATNLLNIGVLSSNMTSQAATINKMLAVMRTRKEIKT